MHVASLIAVSISLHLHLYMILHSNPFKFPHSHFLCAANYIQIMIQHEIMNMQTEVMRNKTIVW